MLSLWSLHHNKQFHVLGLEKKDGTICVELTCNDYLIENAPSIAHS